MRENLANLVTQVHALFPVSFDTPTVNIAATYWKEERMKE